MVKVLDLVLLVHDLAGERTLSPLGIANKELRVFGSLSHAKRRQLPDALDRTRRSVCPEQSATPLDKLGRRAPDHSTERLKNIRTRVERTRHNPHGWSHQRLFPFAPNIGARGFERECGGRELTTRAIGVAAGRDPRGRVLLELLGQALEI
jgi:hypothetical protein